MIYKTKIYNYLKRLKVLKGTKKLPSIKKNQDMMIESIKRQKLSNTINRLKTKKTESDKIDKN